MKRFVFLFSVLCVFSSTSLAKVSEDSLVNVIRYSKNDTFRLKAYSLLADKVFGVDQDSAISLRFEALVIAQQLKLKEKETQLFEDIGIHYWKISNYQLALEFFEKAEDNVVNVLDSLSQARLMFYKGLCYNEMGDYQQSIDNYYKSLVIYEEQKDSTAMARLINNIGVNLEAMGEYESALMLYKKAYYFKQKNNDFEGVVNSYINIGNIMLALNKLDSSLYYHGLGLQGANLLRNDRLFVESLICLGNDHLESNNALKAISFFERALSIFDRYTNNYQLSLVYYGLAKAHKEEEQPELSINYLQRNIGLIKSTGSINLLKDSYLLYADILHEIGGYDQAFKALKEYTLIKDSVYNSEKISSIAEMQEKYKADKNQKEIEQLRFEREIEKIKNEKQKTYLYALVLIAIVLVVFLIGAIFMFKQRNDTNQLLNQSLKEKEVLIKEVHHRVKNNFQLISSLLNLQSDLVKDKEALNAIADARNRISSMALVHKNLYMTESLTSIEMETYIGQLLENIISTSDKGNVNISYNFEANGVSFDVDTSVPLGLIINELLTNSIKYAFTQRDEGTIDLSIRKIDGDKYELLYADNGVGLPKEINLDNLSSLGLELVQLLAAQLGGGVTYTVDKGTRFKIIFNKA